MFTGIIEATGKLGRRQKRGPGDRLQIVASLGELELGESIAVSGACLTVVEHSAEGFSADVSVETNHRTTLGQLGPGDGVNLERSLKLGDRLGGHLVSGHIDGVAEVTRIDPQGDTHRVEMAAPRELMPFIATKGSVALDGVSLTVNGVSDAGFEVMLIPHTMHMTTLSSLAVGRRLNLEVDLFARYVARYVAATRGAGRDASEDALGIEPTLKRAGFI